MALPRTRDFAISHSFSYNPQDKRNYCAIQVQFRGETIISLPVDSVDNTVTGVISAEALNKLGSQRDECLSQLAEYAKTKFGAKQFINVPVGVLLPGYKRPQEHSTFKRLREVKAAAILERTANVLNEYKDLVAKLDSKLKVIVGEEKIESDSKEEYPEEGELLEKYADFSASKKLEHRSGHAARFRNSAVQTVRLIDSETKPSLKGILRVLNKGNGKAYLSDETIEWDLIPLEKFKGNTKAEQAMNRRRFLLAYLINKGVIAIASQFDDLQIIAAPGTNEDEEASKKTGIAPFGTRVYEEIGFEPANGLTVMMSLTSPGPALTDVKAKLLAPKGSLTATVSESRGYAKPVKDTSAEPKITPVIPTSSL
jgi:hypothetical protein